MDIFQESARTLNNLFLPQTALQFKYPLKKKNLKNEKISFVVCGNLRKQGRSDEILNGLVEENDYCN